MNTRRKIIAVLFAILIIAIGVIIIGNNAFGWKINIFIDGWWALLLMIGALFLIIKDGPNFLNIMGLLFFGVLFLKYHITLLKDVNIWLVILGMLVVFIGVSIIVRAFKPRKKVVTSSEENGETKTETVESNSVAFGSSESNFSGKTFSGGTYSCSFGTYKIDLRGATITTGVTLEVNCSFGRIDVIVPAGTTVEVNRTVFLGGVNCTAPETGNADMKINACSSFGSVNISIG